MGLLRFANTLLDEEPELVDSAIEWLKRECKAEILYEQYNGAYLTIRFEGEDIPVGEKQFGITIRILVKGVHSIVID